MDDMRQRVPSSPQSNEKENLSQQYGGIHAGTWVDRLPHFWIPYVQLSRLSPPVALFLIYLPHLFGILHAATVYKKLPAQILLSSVVLLGGSLFFSNAAHAWNDLIDAPIDKRIARTKNRPIARGTITSRAALIFTASQAVVAASFLLWLPASTSIATVPTILGTTYYPWSKRHTYFPQVVLGFCLAWGTIVGCAAMGADKPWKDQSSLCLVLVSTFWTMIFDTIYAYQDIEDDIKVGVKSTAVLFGSHTKIFLWICLTLMGVSMFMYGYLAALGIGYYVVTLSGCIISLGTMIARVDLSNEASCWWWFTSDFWFTGASIAGGLLLEYVVHQHSTGFMF